MVKGILLSRMVTRYSMFMALRAAEQELRSAAKAGKIPIAAGITVGIVVGWFISGFIGAFIGGLSGAIVINAYRRK